MWYWMAGVAELARIGLCGFGYRMVLSAYINAGSHYSGRRPEDRNTLATDRHVTLYLWSDPLVLHRSDVC